MRLTAQAETHGRGATLYRRRLAGVAREQQAVARCLRDAGATFTDRTLPEGRLVA